MFVVVLPYPPSTNTLFRNVPGRGRVKTKAYKTWQNAAGWEVRRSLISSSAVFPLPGRHSLKLELVKPDRRKRDISNAIKAVEDILVEYGVIEDDSLVHEIHVLQLPASEADFAGCRVTVESMAERAAA